MGFCEQAQSRVFSDLSATIIHQAGFTHMKLSLMLPMIPMLLASCLSSPTNLSGQCKVLREVAYVKAGHDRQKLDLYLPETERKEAAPVVIAIHGGAWAFGDKANDSFVKPKCSWFVEQGFIVASINYRLSPAVTHPAHIQDVIHAMAWVAANIAKHGGDPKQIYLLGHSAGAHLAALAAVDEKRLQAAGVDPKSIMGVILLDGAAYDVRREASRALRRDNMFTRAFTMDPDTQTDASPTSKVAIMQGTPPPFLILHIILRQESKRQSEALAAALKAKGAKVELLALRGKTHGSINRDMGKPGDATTIAVEKFLKSLR